MGWLRGGGGAGRRWNPGFCSDLNHFCMKKLKALNTENIAVLPYIIKIKTKPQK